MLRARVIAAAALAVVCSAPVLAQDVVVPDGPVAQPRGAPQPPVAAAASSSVLIVDFDRLFSQSMFGERIQSDYVAARDELVAEQRRIASALRQEELELADQRASMAADVFRAEAEAFDDKARGIRRAQDAKVDALESSLTEARNQFLEVSRPVLEQLLAQNGATVLLERRSALLWLPRVDITDAAIARVDAVIGDGATSPRE